MIFHLWCRICRSDFLGFGRIIRCPRCDHAGEVLSRQVQGLVIHS